MREACAEVFLETGLVKVDGAQAVALQAGGYFRHQVVRTAQRHAAGG